MNYTADYKASAGLIKTADQVKDPSYGVNV